MKAAFRWFKIDILYMFPILHKLLFPCSEPRNTLVHDWMRSYIWLSNESLKIYFGSPAGAVRRTRTKSSNFEFLLSKGNVQNYDNEQGKYSIIVEKAGRFWQNEVSTGRKFSKLTPENSVRMALSTSFYNIILVYILGYGWNNLVTL